MEASHAAGKPDLMMMACCAASPILVPFFVIGVTLALVGIAVAGEIVDCIYGRKAGLAENRAVANAVCHGR